MIRKSAWILVVACIAAGLVFAPAASAHTLSKDEAEDRAEQVSKNYISPPNGKARNKYKSVKITSCRRLFPHQFRCKREFTTHRGNKCRDVVVPHYKAHGFVRPEDVFVGNAGHSC